MILLLLGSRRKNSDLERELGGMNNEDWRRSLKDGTMT